jgi:tetratricopeptide (TPR) repeat protein
MKHRVDFLIILLSGIFVCFQSFAQPVDHHARFEGHLNRFISTKIKYPIDLAQQNIDGLTVISFNISDTGELDSVIVDSSPHQKLTNMALAALAETVGKWTPAMLNDEPQAERYKIVVNYSVQSKMPPVNQAKVQFEKAKNRYEKGKYEKSLKALDRAIDMNPYYARFYQFRSQVNQALGNGKEAEQDVLKGEQTENKVLAVCDVFMVGVTTTRVVSTKVVEKRRIP